MAYVVEKGGCADHPTVFLRQVSDFAIGEG